MHRGASYKVSPYVVREYIEKGQGNNMPLCKRKRMQCLWEAAACAICFCLVCWYDHTSAVCLTAVGYGESLQMHTSNGCSKGKIFTKLQLNDVALNSRLVSAKHKMFVFFCHNPFSI